MNLDNVFYPTSLLLVKRVLEANIIGLFFLNEWRGRGRGGERESNQTLEIVHPDVCARGGHPPKSSKPHELNYRVHSIH